MRSCTGRQLGSQRPHSPRWPKGCTYLEDLGVGATTATMAGMHPGSRQVSRAVGTQGAAALSHAPAALEARVSFEAEATALPQGRAFVEVGCRGNTVSWAKPWPHPQCHPTRLTLDVLRVIDDEVAVPHHRQVHRQVADVIALVGVLRTECSAESGQNPRRQVRACVPLLATARAGCWKRTWWGKVWGPVLSRLVFPIQSWVPNRNTWPPTNLGTNPLLPHPAPPPSL